MKKKTARNPSQMLAEKSDRMNAHRNKLSSETKKKYIKYKFTMCITHNIVLLFFEDGPNRTNTHTHTLTQPFF